MIKARAEPGARVALRIPEDLKAWLAQEAERTWTSQNAQVIRAIRLAKAQDQQPERAVG